MLTPLFARWGFDGPADREPFHARDFDQHWSRPPDEVRGLFGERYQQRIPAPVDDRRVIPAQNFHGSLVAVLEHPVALGDFEPHQGAPGTGHRVDRDLSTT